MFHGHELETPCTVEYEFEPGEKEIRYGDNAYPGCDPTVSVDRVTIDATGEDITQEITQDEDEEIKELIILDKSEPEDEGY
jgi:hypothetical protein